MVGPAAATLSKGSAPALRKSLCFYFFYFFASHFCRKGGVWVGQAGLREGERLRIPVGQSRCSATVCGPGSCDRREGWVDGWMDGRMDG